MKVMRFFTSLILVLALINYCYCCPCDSDTSSCFIDEGALLTPQNEWTVCKDSVLSGNFTRIQNTKIFEVSLCDESSLTFENYLSVPSHSHTIIHRIINSITGELTSNTTVIIMGWVYVEGEVEIGADNIIIFGSVRMGAGAKLHLVGVNSVIINGDIIFTDSVEQQLLNFTGGQANSTIFINGTIGSTTPTAAPSIQLSDIAVSVGGSVYVNDITISGILDSSISIANTLSTNTFKLVMTDSDKMISSNAANVTSITFSKIAIIPNFTFSFALSCEQLSSDQISASLANIVNITAVFNTGDITATIMIDDTHESFCCLSQESKCECLSSRGYSVPSSCYATCYNCLVHSTFYYVGWAVCIVLFSVIQGLGFWKLYEDCQSYKE